MTAGNVQPIFRNDDEPEHGSFHDVMTEAEAKEAVSDYLNNDIPDWLCEGLGDAMLGVIGWERFGHLAERHLTSAFESHVSSIRDLREDPA